jgi:uncharacterized protein YjaZ
MIGPITSAGRRVPRGFTVVPAYRLVGYFAEEALAQTETDALTYFHDRLRLYIRRLLAGMHGSFAEIGERWTMTQTGDPDLKVVSRAVRTADAHSPRSTVETALVRCQQALPRPDLSARVVLLLGDGQSRALTQAMQNVTGVSLGAQAMLLFFWPAHHWSQTLAYTTAHEYTHLVRNHLFPRGLVNGHMVYVKSQEPDTLLDAMLSEGLADAFAQEFYPEHRPHWIDALKPEVETAVWRNVERRLGITDPQDIRRYLFGDADRVPIWTGYAIGHAIVRSYLKNHPGARPASLVGMQFQTIYQESGYVPGEGRETVIAPEHQHHQDGE